MEAQPVDRPSVSPTQASRAALKRIWLFSGMVLGLYLSVEFLVFRTNLYPPFCKPDSTTGKYEAILRSERERPLTARHEVLVIGDSRLAEGFSARIANNVAAESGFHFSNAAMGGAGPRVWYYLLRDLDPDACRYQFIVLGLDDFSDQDRAEDLAGRVFDLHYVIRRLRFSDIPEFSGSFSTPAKRFEVLLGATLKGLTYKRDLQNFLLHPARRLQELDSDRLNFANLQYSYVGHAESLAGLQADWSQESLRNADHLTSVQKAELAGSLFPSAIPQLGHAAQFRRHWLAKIAGRYQATSTRILFVRLPQGPYIRPRVLRLNNHSVVGDLVQSGSAQVVPENYFDPLQTPELFFDGMHLNREGRLRFSVMLARWIEERMK